MTQIRVELELIDGSFTTRTLRAGQTIQTLRDQITRTNPAMAALAAANQNFVRSITVGEGSTKSFLSTLRDVSIVAATLSAGLSKLVNIQSSWLGSVVRVNSEMERLNLQMRAMSRSSDAAKEAGDNVGYLREMAMQAPFSLQTLTNSFVKLKATGVDPMKGSLKALADGVAAFGGSDEALSRTTLAVTQMSGKGVIQMEELRQQLGEAMPDAVALMARSMGVSMASLIKTISTGTVQAKPALEAFYAELERTYGGRAQMMMQTFEGQAKQTLTLMQNLALGVGGQGTNGVIQQGGFFDTVKNQLTDINKLLGSDMAKGLADSLGAGLVRIITGLRSAAETAFAFRNEIKNLAIGIGALMAFNAVSSAISAFSLATRSAVTSWSAFANNFGAAMSNISLGATGFRSLSTAGLGAQYTMMGLRGAVVAVGVGLSTLIPVIGTIGLVAYAAAEYFDIFGSKVNRAYEDLKRFGAESRKQAQETITANLKAKDSQIGAARKAAGFETISGNATGPQNQRLKDLLAERVALEAEAALLLGDAAQREADNELRIFNNRVLQEVQGTKVAYQAELIELEKQYDAREQQANESGESLEQITKERREAYLQVHIRAAEAELEVHKKSIAKSAALFASADADGKKVLEGQLSSARTMAEASQAKIDEIRKRGVGALDLNLLDKPNDGSKAAARAANHIEALQESVAGLKAEIGGASGAVGEMNQAIANGDYGDIRQGTQAIKDQHAELLLLTAQKEALTKISKGQAKIEGDIESARMKNLEKEFEARETLLGRELTESERIKFRLDNGYYDGLGPTAHIQEAMVGLIQTTNIQGNALNELATVWRDNTFSNASVIAVDKVSFAVERLLGLLNGVGGSLNGINFGGLGAGLPGGGGLLAGPVQALHSSLTFVSKDLADFHAQIKGKTNLMSGDQAKWGTNSDSFAWKSQNLTGIQSDSGMKAEVHKAAAGAFQGFLNELESTGYKVKSLGGYNYRNKVGGNTLSEHAFGNAIDINPGANPFGKEFKTDMPANISAMAAKYGLSWGGDWKNTKDAMHFEWTGQQAPGLSAAQTPAVPTPAVQAAPASVAALPTYNSAANDAALNALLAQRVAKTKELGEALEVQAAAEHKTNDGVVKEAARANYLKDLQAQAREVTVDVDKLGKQYAKLQTEVQKGNLGKSKDIKAPEYANLVKVAKDLDATEKSIAAIKTAQKASGSQLEALEARRLEIVKQTEDAHKKMLDPLYKGASSAYTSLETQLNAYVDEVGKATTTTSQRYKDAQQFKVDSLQQLRLSEQTELGAKMAAETQSINTSLMSERQQRSFAYQQKLAEIEQWIQDSRAAGMAEVDIVAQSEAKKAALRQQYAEQSSPMTAQMKEWGDLQGNLAKQSTQWMDSLAGGITDLITGTGDLKGVINGIMKDMINMLVKYAMSGLMGGGKGAMGGGGKKGGAGGGLKKGMSAVAGGVFHSGGLIGGGGRMSKSISPMAFMGARRMHTGGIVGVPGLTGSEVPIIAQKGEGVFTPEQMSNMGGFATSNSFSISAPITVNGSSGTPEQNDDLANKMAKQMEGSMRSIVSDELRKSSRPGNMGNNRAR